MTGRMHDAASLSDVRRLMSIAQAQETRMQRVEQKVTPRAKGDIVTSDGTKLVREGRAIVAALPSSGLYDGMIVYYQTASMLTDGVCWMLRYNSSEPTYKWQYVGGPSWIKEVDTLEALASTGSYTDLATSGPTVTTPLAGDWIVDVGCAMYDTGNNSTTYMSFAVGGAGAVDADSVVLQNLATAGTRPVVASVARRRKKTGVAASSAIQAKYKCDVANGEYEFRYVALTPIRLG